MEMKKHVLVLASTFPRWPNDTTPRFVLDATKGLTNTYSFTVLAPHHKNALANENMEGIPVKRFRYFFPAGLQRLAYGGGILPNFKQSLLAKIQAPFFFASEFVSAIIITKQKKSAMVHAHWILPQGLIAALVKKFLGIPYLITIHGSDLFAASSPIMCSFKRFALRNANAITVNTGATRQELLKFYPHLDVSVSIIPMGIDTKLFKEKKQKSPSRYKKNKILLCVGRLSEQKGFQYAIEALSILIKKNPSIHLVIIGEGPYQRQLQEIARNLNVEKNIAFLGALSHKKVAGFMAQSHIFLMPSLSGSYGTEALGLSVLEAMASRSAIVATNIGGLPQIIHNNETGLLVPQKNAKKLADAIQRLLDDESLRSQLAVQGQSFAVSRYSWQTIHAQFRKVYEAIL